MVFSPYITAVSQSSVLSRALLNQSQVERMLAASSAKESFRVLYDLSWAASASEASGIDDFEHIINSGLHEIKTSLITGISDSPLAKVLFLPFDLQNAKTTLAAFLKGKKYEEFHNDLSSLSFFSRKTAQNILSEKGAPLLAAFFEKALLNAKKITEESPENIQEAQNMLDAAFYKEIHKAVQKTGNKTIIETFQKQIDTENIKRVLRTPENIFFLSPQETTGFFSLSQEEAKSKLIFSPMKDFLQQGEEQKSEGKTLADIELKMELQIIGDLFWTARSHPAGEENILLLFLTKLRNAEVIRTILVGKRNGFSEKEIRESVSIFLPFLPAV